MSDDLMYADEVKEIVRGAYSGIESSTEAVAEKLYAPDELARVPASARERALGVANHLRHATIEPGDVVLDVGCGGGIDTFLAARRTGPGGEVVALDFLPEMLARTESGAAEAGLANVRPLESEMESIALPDDSVDVVISNGVINLSARKSRVMAECVRVLRPAGRFCVSDLTVEEGDLPPEIATHPAAWAGCVAGALAEDDFIHKLENAGFEEVEVVSREPLSIDDCALYPLFPEDVIELMRRLIEPEKQQRVASSVIVRARAPVGPVEA